MARYPDTPGYKERTTSRESAALTAARAEPLRQRCLAALKKRGPMTPDEIADDLQESILAVRPRISELRSKALVRATGERRRNAISGRQALVFVRVQAAYQEELGL
jgi:predicted ArsR family transcriptional regulator